MNASHNLARDIANAELAGDAALLAAIARDLLTLQRGNSEQRTAKKKAAPKGKSAGHEYLTRTELLALGLKPFKESKISGGAYRWVLVEFSNGLRMLTGQYPRVKDADNLAPSIISARARYLGILSGGRLLDAKHSKKVPRVVDVRELTDRDAIDLERERCGQMRMALEVFAPGGIADNDAAQRAWQARADARTNDEICRAIEADKAKRVAA